MRRLGVRVAGSELIPCAVEMGRAWVEVAEVAERWVVELGWWRTSPGRWERRAYWRVLLDDGSCLDLYCDRADDSWRLARLWG